tara:strand:- start:440 stop:595 length:156 start_codon:yes stop_codon:yes gene_type:complete
MTWVLVSLCLLGPVDPKVKVIAVFDNQKNCEVMLEEISKFSGGFFCLSGRK